MRDALAARDGQRLTVEATVKRYGSRIVWGDYREPTICLGPITTTTGEFLTDHCWFKLGKRLAALDLGPGDAIRFTAHVRPYRRGQRRLPDGSTTYSVGFQLVYPSRIVLLARAPEPAPVPVSTPSLPAPTPEPELVPMQRPRGPSNRDRLLEALAGLRERAEPVSLVRLLATLPMSPINAIKLLRGYAAAGTVIFTQDGGLFVPPTSTMNGSH